MPAASLVCWALPCFRYARGSDWSVSDSVCPSGRVATGRRRVLGFRKCVLLSRSSSAWFDCPTAAVLMNHWCFPLVGSGVVTAGRVGLSAACVQDCIAMTHSEHCDTSARRGCRQPPDANGSCRLLVAPANHHFHLVEPSGSGGCLSVKSCCVPPCVVHHGTITGAGNDRT